MENYAEFDSTILIVGFNRGLETNWPSIRSHVVESLRNQGLNPAVMACISSSNKRLRSKRIHEDGWTSEELPQELVDSCHTLLHHKASVISRKTIHRFLISSLFGDPWPETRFKSLRNLIHLLELQSSAAKNFVFPDGPIVVIRADLQPIEDLKLKSYERHYQNFIITPNWHRWGYANDRVAIGPPHLIMNYLSRGKLIYRFLFTHGSLHAEKFLYWSIMHLPRKHVLEEKFARTRAGGVVVSENYTIHNHSFFGV